jgi:hypothetical protein
MREPTKAAIAHGRRMPTSSLCVLRKIKRCERIQSLGRPTEVCGSPTLGVPDSIEVARLSPEMGGFVTRPAPERSQRKSNMLSDLQYTVFS